MNTKNVIEIPEVIDLNAGTSDLRVSAMSDVAWWIINNTHNDCPKMREIAYKIITQDNDILNNPNETGLFGREAQREHKRKKMTRTFLNLVETCQMEINPLRDFGNFSPLNSLMSKVQEAFESYR